MSNSKMPTTLAGALADAERHSDQAWTDEERLAFKQGCWIFAMLIVKCHQDDAVARLQGLLEEALAFEKDLGAEEA